jgi:hypothetical protein
MRQKKQVLAWRKALGLGLPGATDENYAELQCGPNSDNSSTMYRIKQKKLNNVMLYEVNILE